MARPTQNTETENNSAPVDTPETTPAPKFYTQEEVNDLVKKASDEAFQKGVDETSNIFQGEIEKLSEELSKKENAIPLVSKKGLPQVRVNGLIYELKTLGKITIGTEHYNAHDLVKDQELCEELIEEGSTLFQRVEE
ncbi:hypothetical protein [Flectobacillus roseus]|uniref:hypothetical protein n=1 Tax=Flectobacillus roseus TaxID=502259 RepID=UPI0024B64CC5|nr:hypothetical protein [Flectobacillus roseus]MDI9870567.1 hypothetical protein [Flectobacillus roseus]